MKHNFMNKENGKVASVLVMYLDDDGHMQTDSYDKIEDLMEDYAAYGPAEPEPLIKDEKIRKAVKAWAELFDEVLLRAAVHDGFVYLFCDMEHHSASPEMDIPQESFGDGILSGHYYTIAELCGEEEE